MRFFKRPFNIFIILTFIVVVIVYYFLEIEKGDELGLKMKLRQMGTYPQLWLNGYLGVFFNFMSSGNVTWITLVLLPMFLYKNRFKINTWQLGLLFYLLFCCVLVCVKGYFNSRYQITIVPVIIFINIILAYKLFKEKRVVIIYLVVLTILNFGYYFTSNFLIKYSKNVSTLIDKKQPIKQVDWEKYITSISDSSIFLVNNIPEFYYYTNRKGYYYISTVDELYTKTKMVGLSRRSEDSMHLFLKDTLKIDYILSSKVENSLNNEFNSYLNNKTIVLNEDQKGRIIYKLND